jgi:hypothetical protein
MRYNLERMMNQDNQAITTMKRWRKQGDVTDMPRALNNDQRNSQGSSRWIEDGSFTRLQNVTIGYTFDLPRFTGAARNSRVYLSGDNLLLFTGYSGYDPEVFTDAGLGTRGIDYLHYPRPRTITGGLRVSF